MKTLLPFPYNSLVVFLIFILFTVPTLGKQPLAELLNMQVDVSVSKGKVQSSYSFDILINEREGDKFADISLYYSDILLLKNVKAAIYDRFGREIRKIGKNDMTDRNEFASYSFYEENFVKEFNLRHNSYPYRVKYSYTTLSRQYIKLASWIPALAYNIPTREASLYISVPDSMQINYLMNKVQDPKIWQEKGRTHYSWDASYEGELESEVNMPPAREIVPFVDVIPAYFYFDNWGSSNSWKEYGNWIYSLMEGMNTLPISEQAEIDKILSGKLSKKELVRKLYHRLQDETRYVNISFETGGLKPYPASYVAQKKYGDCKALTNYFKSVLEYAGITSYYTLVDAGPKISKINRQLPSPQFNHAILMLPLEGDTLWIDCTSDGPFGYTGVNIQGREAFIIKWDESHFERIEAMDKLDCLEEKVVQMNISRSGKVSAAFRHIYQGATFELLHTFYHSTSENIRDLILRNNFIGEGFQPDSFHIAYEGRDSDSIELLVEASSATLVSKYDESWILKIPSFDLLPFEAPEYRVQDVKVYFPVFRKDSLLVRIPPGLRYKRTKEDVNLETEYGSYRIKFNISGDFILLTKEFFISKQEVPLDKYPEFFNFISTVYYNENNLKLLFEKI